MSVLAIKNWAEYQHYKDRTAPWIKLYRDMLDSQMWVMSSDASKLLAVCLMMLALRNDNKIPADPEYVKRFGHLEFTPDFSELIKHGFIDFIDENGECLQLASKALATCPPEREGEGEQRDIKTKEPTSKKSAPVGIKTFLDNCKVSGEERISKDDPVFDFAEKNKIPIEMVSVCWKNFVRMSTESGKRQSDWRRAFRNCVRNNWYKLWYIEADGTVKETSQYRTMKTDLEDSDV